MADEPEPRLLALRVDGDLLSDAVQAMAVGTDVRLPIGELARLLELDASADLTAKRILLGGRRVPFDAARKTATEDDIFAGAKLLSEWFSLQITIDPNASTVTLHASTPLPVQLRRAREQEAARTMARSGSGPLPRIPNPYSLFDGPFAPAARWRLSCFSTATQTACATRTSLPLPVPVFSSTAAHHPLSRTPRGVLSWTIFRPTAVTRWFYPHPHSRIRPGHRHLPERRLERSGRGPLCGGGPVPPPLAIPRGTCGIQRGFAH